MHATSNSSTNTNGGLNSNQDQIENAVIKQELMAAKEEIADLKAKIYVSDKEKTGKITLYFMCLCCRTYLDLVYLYTS